MVTLPDRAIGGPVRSLPPLGAFTTPEELLADALPLLDPPSRISVTDAAERYIRVPVAGVWQQFDRMSVPYIVEPADITQSRRFQGVAFIGASQSAKTTMLQTVAMHAVTCAPDPVQVVHMGKKDAEDWVEDKLNPMIANSPAIRERLGRSREDSTLSRKRFKGMVLNIGYPTAQQLSSRTRRMVLLSDYDHMDQRLGPKDSKEGSPWMMARQRVASYMSRGCVLAESTPAFPINDETWRQNPAAPHEFPPVSDGIVLIYNEGTRGRWYWCCPDCDGLFEPRFDRLHYDASLEPGDAGDTAEMECPNCGSLIAHRHKLELNRRALLSHGGWLHESSKLDEDGKNLLCQIGDDDVRNTPIASYALNGAAALFSNWSTLVEKYENALRRFQVLDDDSDLSVVHYTDIGVPYAPRAKSADGELTVQSLKDGALEGLVRGVAPDWTRFVTVHVDVQGRYFAVLVMAWGEGGKRIPIDRFDMVKPPDGAPESDRERAVDPGRYAEDWGLLADLGRRNWKVSGATYKLRPLACSVDFMGAPGVSDNAEKFWRDRRKEGEDQLWFLVRGHGGLRSARRIWYEAPERGSKGKKARSIRLLNFAADRLKDSVAAALGRGTLSDNGQMVAQWMPEDALSEMASERRGTKGWAKRPGVVRNEGFDLSVHALAVAEHKGLNNLDWSAPPDWAIEGPANTLAIAGTKEDRDVQAAAPRRRIPKKLF